MPNNTIPAANSQTRPNNQGGVTPVSVTPPRKVTYQFTTGSAKNLSLPYAVAVDGAVLPRYKQKPARVRGNGGRISVTVLQGQRVSLYLNSDASPDFQKAPVYPVTAGERNVMVRITEKRGKHPNDTDAPSLQTQGKTEDTYVAPLTGDIWMKISHRYTAAEVDARLPSGTSNAVAAAVKQIYGGLASATLSITEPANQGNVEKTVAVKFADSQNPKDNISSYSLLADGLTRVHPGGWAALFTAALEGDVKSLNVSSCWRPMLGSIAHRAGLGLDASVVGGTVLNRQELRRSRTGNGNDKDNVTDAEVKAFRQLEAATAAKKNADAEVDAAEKASQSARGSGDALAAKARLEKARQAARVADTSENTSRTAWNLARDAGEGSAIRLFRLSLQKCPGVRQLFDPWFMDQDTQDKRAPTPNMQKSGNEKLHANHLHITVDDPKIL